MPVLMGEYLPPAAAARPCCSACASPERRRRRRLGASMVTAAVRSGAARSGTHGLGDPLVWWPSDIEALIKRTDSEVDAVDRDYEAAVKTGKIRATAWANWGDFRNEWKSFKDNLSWYGSISGGTVETVQGYRNRIPAFREILVKAKADPQSTPQTNLPDKGPPVDWGNVIKWGAGAAIVLGAALALGHVTRLVPKLGS